MRREPSPGTVIAGRYRLDELLGEGGMGSVWAATHGITGKRLALKFVTEEGSPRGRSALHRRFRREALAASAVAHPNVVQIHDVFEVDDQPPIMVMDLLVGETLGARLKRDGRMDLRATADVVVQVASAAGTAHAAGVVHRDLTPSNLFLLRDPAALNVRVLDFGIAKLMQPRSDERSDECLTSAVGTVLGTPCYMSPEQTFGEKDIDHRTDIWALGVILYECLSGMRPIEGDGPGQIAKHLLRDVITPLSVVAPGLPDEIYRLVERMLERERQDRLSDLREVVSVLSPHATVKVPEFGAPTSTFAPELSAWVDDDVGPRASAAGTASAPAARGLATIRPSTFPLLTTGGGRLTVASRSAWTFVGAALLLLIAGMWTTKRSARGDSLVRPPATALASPPVAISERNPVGDAVGRTAGQPGPVSAESARDDAAAGAPTALNSAVHRTHRAPKRPTAGEPMAQAAPPSNATPIGESPTSAVASVATRKPAEPAGGIAEEPPF